MFDGTFRSYFGAICVPILDPGDGTISNVTHDWSNATSTLGAGLAVTVLRLQIKNRRVDIAKERLAELCLKNKVQWAFFLDDDTIPPSNTLLKMIKLWRSDSKYKVISGVYWSKSNPPVPLIFKGNLEGSYWDWNTQDLIKADGAGAGCLFVDTDIFKKMSKPWFSRNYYFEDPRTIYDVRKWQLVDQLGAEFMQPTLDRKKIKDLQKKIEELGKTIRDAQKGKIDSNLLKTKSGAPCATEDLYFFKKAKEELDLDLWIDCSIQCQHQDKRTGRMFGLSPDMPQAQSRYKGKMKRGKKIVLDLGCGYSPNYIPEGESIRVDIDPRTNPDVVGDVRILPFEDCFADVVYASHILEHFSFKETIRILKEWTRVLKVGGKMIIVVPNLKWASNIILKGTPIQELAERAMSVFYSTQDGAPKDMDIHKAGFTSESLKGVVGRLGCYEDIEVHTTEGNYSNWKKYLNKEDAGYNVILFAKKKKHSIPISLKLPIKEQEEAMYEIGPKAKLEKKSKKPKKKVKKKTKKKGVKK